MFLMKMGSFFFLILFFSGLSAFSYAEDTSIPVDYCYKPDKPLFFATQYYKNRYADDVEQYKSCVKSFIEMQNRVAKMQQESEKNSLTTWNNFINHQKNVQY